MYIHIYIYIYIRLLTAASRHPRLPRASLPRARCPAPSRSSRASSSPTPARSWRPSPPPSTGPRGPSSRASTCKAPVCRAFFSARRLALRGVGVKSSCSASGKGGRATLRWAYYGADGSVAAAPLPVIDSDVHTRHAAYSSARVSHSSLSQRVVLGVCIKPSRRVKVGPWSIV